MVKKEKKRSNQKKIEEEVSMAKGTYAWLRRVVQLGDRVGDKSRSEVRLPDQVERE